MDDEPKRSSYYGVSLGLRDDDRRRTILTGLQEQRRDRFTIGSWVHSFYRYLGPRVSRRVNEFWGHSHRKQRHYDRAARSKSWGFTAVSKNHWYHEGTTNNQLHSDFWSLSVYVRVNPRAFIASEVPVRVAQLFIADFRVDTGGYEGEPRPSSKPFLYGAILFALGVIISLYAFWDLQFGEHDWGVSRTIITALLILVPAFLLIAYGAYLLLDSAEILPQTTNKSQFALSHASLGVCASAVL
jgi:hypothetical protein